MTEARARLELREEATEQDASDVVEIMKFSMNDTFSDQYGILDFDRSQHGSGMSQRAQVYIVWMVRIKMGTLATLIGKTSFLSKISVNVIQWVNYFALRNGWSS